MIGWLINGVWVAISAVTAVQWLVMSADGKKWVKAETIDQWVKTAEDKRAIQVSVAGEQILVEKPKTIERYDLNPLMFSDTQQMQLPQKRPDANTAGAPPIPGIPTETAAQLAPKPAGTPLKADGMLTA